MVTIVEVSDYEVACNSMVVLSQEYGEQPIKLLCSDGKTVIVSGVLLQKYSQVFEEVLGCADCVGGIPVKEESSQWQAFVGLLEAHVNGSYNLDTASMVNIVTIADKYNFQQIMLLCDEYLAASPNIAFSTEQCAHDWVFAWLLFAERYVLKRTKERCLKFIQLNTRHIDFQSEEVTACLQHLGFEDTLLLIQLFVKRLNEVDAEYNGVKNACTKEGLELHYIPVLKQHVINKKRVD
eukprot:TRINITY_DN3580_c2_g1_i2.p4 TRINITY_DN3580_c2_g1~~TRINITY_DN3580_c2_g1_i2.p4  ORF type:complete len:237 (-),score=17.53 TRINITY_DN3580_c2_g1_i2:2678-3388(-)